MNDFEKKVENDLKACEDNISHQDSGSGENIASYEEIVKQIRSDTISGTKSGGGSEIPEFNLAEHIMSRQRKVTATRRRKPGEQKQEQAKSAKEEVCTEVSSESCDVKLSRPKEESDEIIREIVARDIARILRQTN